MTEDAKKTNRAIKVRIYPTDDQMIMFAKTFGCCRKVYNLMLSDICNVVNTYLANHHKENEEDFNRNVLANMLSQFLDIGYK